MKMSQKALAAMVAQVAGLTKSDAEGTALLQQIRGAPTDRSAPFSGALVLGRNIVLLEKSDDPKVVEMQTMNDDLLILKKLLAKADEPVRIQDTRLYKRAMRSELGKAMAAGTSGSGSDWVPTLFSAEMIDLIRLQLKVVALFAHVPMPSNPFKLPLLSSDGTAYLIDEETADSGTKATASTPGTGAATLTAKKIAARHLFSTEVTEDSIVPVLPMLRNNVARVISQSWEKAVIDGSTATWDSGVGSTDVRKAFDGLRYYATTVLSQTKDLSTFNIANVRAIRALLVEFGVDPDSLAWIAGPRVYQKHLIGLDEVSTVDKYGDKAVILTGELAKLDGIPVIVSGQMAENLNANGRYDASVTSKGILLLVNRNAFVVGDRRQITLKTDELIETDQTVLVATQRAAFQRVWTSGTVVAAGTNIDIS